MSNVHHPSIRQSARTLVPADWGEALNRAEAHADPKDACQALKELARLTSFTAKPARKQIRHAVSFAFLRLANKLKEDKKNASIRDNCVSDAALLKKNISYKGPPDAAFVSWVEEISDNKSVISDKDLDEAPAPYAF